MTLDKLCETITKDFDTLLLIMTAYCFILLIGIWIAGDCILKAIREKK